MAAVDSVSDVISLATGGGAGAPEFIYPFKSERNSSGAVATVAGRWTSLWENLGQQPTHGSPPGGTARNPTRATAGAIGQTNPGGGRQKWLLGMNLASSSAIGSMVMADRLADISGLSGTSASAQSITGLSVSRYTGTASVGNQIYVEIYTQIGTTATTGTLSYTNQDGTSGRTSGAFAIGGTGLREVGRMIRVPLQSGDTGVRSVESLTLALSTGTAGDIGVTIVRPLAGAVVPTAGTGVAGELLVDSPGPVEILTDAALYFYWLANGTSGPELNASLSMVEK